MANKKFKLLKAQSAMEYLMTYGWAILIIAVVLGALFQLGVFSGASLVGTSCIGSPGYLCKSPTLTASGYLTFTLGQNTGATLYNVELACASSPDSTGQPYPNSAYNSISSSGLSLPASTTGNSLVNGQTLTISQLPCYSPSGTLSSGNIGASFSGYIWVQYTTQSGAEGAGNLWYTNKAMTIRLKASS